jgi:hypothetical protein
MGRRALVTERKVLTAFYGYPAEIVARWCAVSLDTAKLYKAGKRKPSRQSLKLFALHRDGYVLGEEWCGWAAREGKLIDPEGNSTTQAQLRAYWIVMQYAAELARRDPADYDLFQTLLRRA